jgi:hypothetical protein
MAFLDNSGDIVLDAVLTDTGRMRLAKGDGSFRVTKFALGDDEINYALYDKSSPSGSAYYATQILQTPIFEAFSNNIASLNSRLVSFSRNDLLFLPVLIPNNKFSPYAIPDLVLNGYVLAVDLDTENFFTENEALTYSSNTVGQNGLLLGITPANGSLMRIDQGINNTQIPPSNQIDPDLLETQYLLEVDSRFASIVDKDGVNALSPSYIDDDYIAAYYVSQGTNPTYVETNTNKETGGQEVIAGSRGTTLKFKLKSALNVSTSDYLFNQLGTDETNEYTGDTTVVGNNVRHILTSVRVTGLTTGAFVEVPIVLVKKIS